MNDSLSELRKVCEERGIKRVAMIDDVFDVPTAEGVEREQYAEFVDRFQSDDPLRRAIARVGGEVRGLPDFEALGEDDLEPLWRCVYGAHVPGPKLDTQQAETVRALFGGHDDGVLDMLDDVRGLLELFWKDLEREVAVHGARPEPGDVANADIVVVDYYLERRCTDEEAARRTSSIVKDIVGAARQGRGRVPQFLLVSSRPQAIDPGAFREHAELMNSRFRFFTKRALSTRAVEHLVNLHDLVDASDRTEKIERLVRDWGTGGRKAIESVEQHMLDLDVSDLVYLDYFRLVNEGANIGEYLPVVPHCVSGIENSDVTGPATLERCSRYEASRAGQGGREHGSAHAHQDVRRAQSGDCRGLRRDPPGPESCRWWKGFPCAIGGR